MIATLILLPLAGAVLAFLVPRRKSVVAGLFGAIATSLHTLLLVWWMGGSGERGWMDPAVTALGGWPAPLGIELHVDGLGVLLLLVMAGVGLVVSVYSAWFGSVLEEEKREVFRLFWPLWLILWAALNGMFIARDLFTLYILLELGLLAAVALAGLSGTATGTAAALRYLLAAMVGSFAYLMGVGILYSLHGTVDLHALAAVVEGGPASATAVCLMTLGLMVKTAVFPLHFWLPKAHGSAPAPVSALLSGLVIKGSFLILLRLWIEFGEAVVSVEWGQLLGASATAAIVWGSLQALRQKRLKMLIAYSTVAQVGVLFILFPLLAGVSEGGAGGWRLDVWAGGAIHASSHAMAKASLFLGAGVVFLSQGSDELAEMRGLAWRLPLTVTALLLGGLALVGVPLSGTHAGKGLLLFAARAEGQWWWVPVLHGATFLSAAYVIAMLRFTVLPERRGRAREEWAERAPVAGWVQVIPLALAAGAVLLGWPREALLALLRSGAAGIGP